MMLTKHVKMFIVIWNLETTVKDPVSTYSSDWLEYILCFIVTLSFSYFQRLHLMEKPMAFISRINFNLYSVYHAELPLSSEWILCAKTNLSSSNETKL